MTALEDVPPDILHILCSFDHFVNLIENDNWLRNNTKYDLTLYFKIATFIEHSIDEARSKDCLDAFIDTLNSWWRTKNRTLVYNIEFYSLACDHLLAKFFKSPGASTEMTDNAVRIYTSLHSKTRLENMLTQLMLSSTAHNALAQLISTNCNINLEELHAKTLIHKWSVEFAAGRVASLRSFLESMTSNYNIQSSLSILLKVLSLKNCTADESKVQNLILQYFKSSHSNKPFWYCLFKNADKHDLALVASAFPEFRVALFNFIFYIGSTMYRIVCDCEIEWVVDRKVSLFPEITYKEIKDVVKACYDFSEELRQFIIVRLFQANSNTFCNVWEDLKNDMF